MKQKTLMIVTSHGELGSTGQPTGFWWEELAVPYWTFTDAGLEVEIASVRGGHPRADPKSVIDELTDEQAIAALARFHADRSAMAKLVRSQAMSQISATAYDLVFVVGGHGAMWDMPGHPVLSRVLLEIESRGGILAAVCHGPAAFDGVLRADGRALVEGLEVTGFSNAEEQANGLADVVPFLLEDRLRENGAKYTAGPPWQPHVAASGRLVTGQNPASSLPTAVEALAALARQPRRGPVDKAVASSIGLAGQLSD
jgi:putative intracellular protease/amidase